MRPIRLDTRYILSILSLGMMLAGCGDFPSKEGSENVDIQVKIKTREGQPFLTEEDILAKLKRAGIMLTKESDKIDIQQIEEIVSGIPEVQSATCYRTIQNRLVITVKLRTPFVKMSEEGTTFFLDAFGVKMPLTQKNKGIKVLKINKIDHCNLTNEAIVKGALLLKDCPYWDTVVSQVNIGEEGVTVVCNNGISILCGGWSEMVSRLSKLRPYMESENCCKLLNYSQLDIRYEGQIIGRGRYDEKKARRGK